MKLVAEVVGLEGAERSLDGAIYPIDPVDPSSIFRKRPRSSANA